MFQKNILRLALQKNGRITEQTLSLLEKAGLIIPKSGRQLRTMVTNFPLEILFLRSKDIPELITDTVADSGIVGQNVLSEHNSPDIEENIPLGFGSCRLCLAVPKNIDVQSPSDYQGKSIATSYPNILEKYLLQKNITAKIIPMEGSVEVAPSLNIADSICDLVSSGETLFANHLRETETIFESEVVLASHVRLPQEKKEILNNLILRLQSVLQAENMKSVVMNAPVSALRAIEEILPGLESPTIMPLQKKDWIAIHSVVKEDEQFWERITDLKKAGATGILISPIDRIIF